MAETENKLKRLIEVASSLNSTLNLQELVQSVLAVMAELLEAESGSMLLLDEATDELVFEVATANPELVKQRMPADQGIAGAAMTERTTIVVPDTSADPRFYHEVDRLYGSRTRNLVAIPVLLKGSAIGVIEAVNRPVGELSPDDLEIAVALASLAAVAIDNAHMYARLTDAVVAARMSYRL